MATPTFNHIHCSSYAGSSAALLEHDLDNFMEHCSILTLTEVGQDHKAAQMREKGWDYFKVLVNNGADQNGVAWKKETWHAKKKVARRLHQHQWRRHTGKVAQEIHADSVVLQHTRTGHRLLVSVTHMPSNVQHKGQEGPFDVSSRNLMDRKIVYLESLKGWNTHVRHLNHSLHVDATMIISDWNLNLKDQWVRRLLRDTFGPEYKHAWTRFPTSGGSFFGGPVVPLGKPGAGWGNRIIDGTLYRGLKLEEHPNLMARVRSSDHRPYKETFRLKDIGEREDPVTEEKDITGNTKPGEEWWGFGDFLNDEIYPITTVTGEEGGEVL